MVIAAFVLLVPELSTAQCGVNILINPSFETPVQPSIGNNLTGLSTIAGWTMTGGTFNIIRTNGSAYGGGPDNAWDGVQYVDVTSSAGTVYQDFTISSTTNVAFGGYFSSRESAGYVNWAAVVSIYAMPSNVLVALSSTRNFTPADGGNPAQENWYYLFGNTNLTPGNYRFVANIGDFGNFDNGFVFSNCFLPITLEYFSVKQGDDKNVLNWKADAPSNFSHFEIERSTDGRNFSAIGKVPLGNESTYSFTDNNIKGSNLLYYRLKMVDLDDSYKYSAIVTARNGDNNRMTVNPNPAKDFISVNGLTKKGELTITDISGKLLRRQVVNGQSISFPIDNLKNGLYLLQYFDGEQRKTMKFIKM